MELIIGVLIGIILALVGYILKTRKPRIEKKELSFEEKEKREHLKKSFESLMRYDFETAIRRK